jgi:hypothetical protein
VEFQRMTRTLHTFARKKTRSVLFLEIAVPEFLRQLSDSVRENIDRVAPFHPQSISFGTIAHLELIDPPKIKVRAAL